MCQDCGCSITDESKDKNMENIHNNPLLNDKKSIDVIKKILHKNDHQANHNREHLDKNSVLGINLMSSPGSGKTTMLENLVDICEFKYAVIEGDLQTSKDAIRLQDKGIRAYQITTGTACHLDAFMVHKAMHHIDMNHIDVCFVENVGNLVCPASYDIGTHLNIVLVSIPEGNDKIAKYPVMFAKADLVLFTKTDLLPYFDYDMENEIETLKRLNPHTDILKLDIHDKESMKKLNQWIYQKIKNR